MTLRSLKEVDVTKSLRLILPALIILGACSSESAGPDAMVQDVFKSLDEGHAEVLWDALPSSYQTDIKDVVSLFAQNMDEELYNKGFSVVNKLVDVLQMKKTFILGHPMIMGMTEGKIQDETYDAIVKTLQTYTKSDISTLQGVKNLDIRSFLQKTGSNAVTDLQQLSKLGDEAPPIERFQDIKVELIDQSGDVATLKLTAGEEEPEEVEFTKVEGKWVPKEMADKWPEGIADAKAKMNDLPDQITPEAKTQAMMGMDMALSALGQLEAAQSQEEFNTALGSIMGMAMGGMGGPPSGMDDMEE